MAGLGGRMSTTIKAKISRMLDRAEDPGETLDYGYNKQLELLQNVKKGIADVVTAKKRIQMQAHVGRHQIVGQGVRRSEQGDRHQRDPTKHKRPPSF